MGGRRAPTWTFGVALLAATALFSAGVVRDGARGPSGRMEVAAADRHTAVPPPAKRLFGGPLPGMQLDGQALEFEPDAYRRYYPDVSGDSDEKLAQHYLSGGRSAQRVGQRMRVIMSYEAAAGVGGNKSALFGGLCNQIYSHVGMLSLALQMGAEMVLPEAVHRGGRGFQDDFYAGKVQPIRAPLGTLFDVEHLLAWGASVSAVFHEAAPPVDGRSIEVTVDGRSLCCMRSMDDLVARVRQRVVRAAEAFVKDNPGEPLPAVSLTLEAPSLMFALATNATHTELVEEVSRNLRPAANLRGMAEVIVARLTAGGSTFNGVHLRMEDDAHFTTVGGGAEAFLASYFELMEVGHCDATTPMYVASGLLTYLSPDEFDATFADNFTRRGVCSSVVVKERLLDDSQRKGLLSEALALVDLLVLVHARHFTGFWFSSFSWIVQEYRCLHGTPTTSTAMVRVDRNWLPGHFEASGALSNHSLTCPGFSVNMGTGIVSILLHTAPHKFRGMADIGTGFYLLNIALFVLFTTLSVARYTLYPWVLTRMAKHPAQLLFVGTFPMGFATIVSATALIAVPRFGQWARDLTWTLWWIDVAISAASVFGVPMLMFTVQELRLESMTAAWLLPVVPAVVAAGTGAVVASTLPRQHALETLLVSYALLGIGLALSFMIMALYFHRLVVHHLPNAEVCVSAFLPLGPCGQGAFAIVQLSSVGRQALTASEFGHGSASGDTVYYISIVLGLMLWGLGLWWFWHGTFTVLFRMASTRLRFNMGFWGFTFPLGVFTSGTVALSNAIPSAFFAYLSLVQLAALVLLWFIIAGRTVIGAWGGDLIVAPCLSGLEIERGQDNHATPTAPGNGSIAEPASPSKGGLP